MNGRLRSSRALIGAATVAVIAAAGGGFLAAQPSDSQNRPAPRPVVSGPPLADYREAVDVALRHHLRVWINADMVKRWEQGPGSFRGAVARVAALANRPGVVGVKVADELGYQDGMDSEGKIRRFLSDTASALHRASPGKQILVDMVVPELGCLPGRQPAGSSAASCAAGARRKYPQLTLDAIDGYLHMHAIDVLDLSTGLLPEKTYAGWGTTEDAAQRAAWQEVRRRGWSALVRLQSRKALAHAGRYDGTAAEAEAEVHTFVDIPLASDAHAVDVWTWRQDYDGATYRLMDPGLQPNVLWEQLQKRRRAGDVLFTNMSPHSVESGLNQDLAMISTVFTDVLLPAGTG